MKSTRRSCRRNPIFKWTPEWIFFWIAQIQRKLQNPNLTTTSAIELKNANFFEFCTQQVKSRLTFATTQQALSGVAKTTKNSKQDNETLRPQLQLLSITIVERLIINSHCLLPWLVLISYLS